MLPSASCVARVPRLIADPCSVFFLPLLPRSLSWGSQGMVSTFCSLDLERLSHLEQFKRVHWKGARIEAQQLSSGFFFCLPGGTQESTWGIPRDPVLVALFFFKNKLILLAENWR